MSEQFDLPFGDATRADQIFARFQAFHAANPRIWTLFKKFTLDLIKVDFEHYSSDAVFQRIRWHVDIETRGEGLKLNDHYRAYYARMFHVAYPQHDGFYRNRKRSSTAEPAAENDLEEFVGPPPGREDVDLIRKLRTMI